MKKRVIILVCVLQLAALLCAAPAAAASILRDGTFETIAVGGTLPSYWSASGVSVQADETHTGVRALVFTPSAAKASLGQFTASEAPVPGESFTASFWVKRTEGAKLTFRYSFIHAANGTIPGTAVEETIDTAVGEWERVSRDFTVHADAKRLYFQLFAEGAPIYVDDIYCMPTAEAAQKDDTPHQIYGDTGENPLGILSCNMDFESVANTAGSNMWQDISEKRTDAIAHTGNWSYHVSTPGDSTLGTTITRNKVVGGATYQVVLWLNVVSSGGTINLKPEFYKDMTSQSSWVDNASAYTAEYSRNLEPMGSLTYGGWRRVVRTFEAPPDAAALRLFIRTFGSAEFYVDDISITQISAAFCGKLTTDAGVYYPDITTGKASLWLNTAAYPLLENTAVNFRLRAPNGAVIYSADAVSQNVEDKAEFTFPVSLLTERKTAYTVEAEIPGVDLQTEKIYCYERPTMISADGSCNIDGKPFQPLVAYHVKAADYAKAAAAGINVVQSFASGGHGAALEAAQEAGIKVLLVLYNGMKPAGHPDNIESTIKAVKTYKDHPALFGYAIMDEPTVYFQDPSAYLMASYKAIRDLDDVHPVWIVEGSATNSESSIELCSKYSDIFAIDHYVPDAQNGTEAEKTLRHVTKARAALAPGRPLYALLEGGGVNSGNAPESIRNQGWQAFLGGADAIGYYMKADNINVGGLLDAIGAFCRTDYAVACTVGRQRFSAQTDGEVLYRRWVENGRTYTLALNWLNAAGPQMQVPAGALSVTAAAALQPLEVWLSENGEAPPLLPGACTVYGEGTVYAGVYSGEELVAFAAGDGAVTVGIPSGPALSLQGFLWKNSLAPLTEKAAFRIEGAQK